jgi:hypothetical protein
MESITRNVKDIAPDERRVYEAAIGHALQDNQRVVIRVVNLGAEPDEATRTAALSRAVEIARQGRAAAAAQGIAPEEAAAAIDESLQEARQSIP